MHKLQVNFHHTRVTLNAEPRTFEPYYTKEIPMAPSLYWPDKYVENKKKAAEALKIIKPGQRVFIGSSCGEPQHLVREIGRAHV